MRMDLTKMDPMARKMRSHVDAFFKAIENNDSVSASSHISEVSKYAEYLSEDVSKALLKADMPQTRGVNDIYAGGVPVRKFNTIQTVHEPTTQVLPGTIRTARRGPIMQRRNNRTI